MPRVIGDTGNPGPGVEPSGRAHIVYALCCR